MKKTGQMQFTAPVQVIYALNQATKEYFEEGEKNRWARYKKNWELLRQGVQEIGFKLLLRPEHQSKILISLLEPSHANYDFDSLHDRLYAKGFTIYPGNLTEKKILRLAVIGDLHRSDILQFLDELKVSLEEMGVKNNFYN